ncbi:hypothetical protein [Nocardia jiangsuensis]|uniref:Uncharacterized protein n=1 Tax=Nocardia jiangsuensis TaxID=1691563 RepID=A0ABV8DP40_9NOCA
MWQWLAVPPVERKPARRSADTVGPSDWPDDFDDYPTRRSWLE